MANLDFFDGDPPASTYLPPIIKPTREPRPTPVDGTHVTGLAAHVKSSPSGLDNRTRDPRYLLCDEGLHWFLSRAFRMLERNAPHWMREDAAWDACVAAVKAVRAHPENFVAMGQAFRYAQRALASASIRIRKDAARWSSDNSETQAAAGMALDDDAPFQSHELQRILHCLPDYLRRTLIAREIIGYSAAEWAEIEGIKVQTVHNRLSLAWKRVTQFANTQVAA